MVPLKDVLMSPDTLLGLGVVGVVMMMILPLPPVLLDLFLSFNIALALIILLTSMYARSALDFSVFPTLLLLATLFRLSLNVSTTRMILMGRGAEIGLIEAFGNFVVGGNYVVGLVVFIILVIIQFLVITKGAERVAEVAARFTLDAMPGKQISIDADFSSGVIDADTMKKRKRDVQREADFYGSMDGASKFVKGDAIFGIIATFINILGGLFIGVFQRGEEVLFAISRYTLFTVGDGLVTQIPALLIATATGVIVTRASSDHNMGTDLLNQVFSEPRMLMMLSGITGFLGFVPGLPKFSFFFLSIFFGSLAYIYQSRLQAVDKKAEQDKVDEEKDKGKPEDVSSLLAVDTLELEIGYNLIPLVDATQGGDLLNRITVMRRQLALDLGLVVPPIRIRDNIQLDPNVYEFKLKGVAIARFQVIPGQFLAMDPGTAGGKLQGEETREPAFNTPAIWIVEEQRERAEMAGYTVVDCSSVMATHLTEVLKNYAPEILGRDELDSLITTTRESNPALVKDLVGEVIKIGKLQKVLQNLLREGVSIRFLALILEGFTELNQPESASIDELTEAARYALRRHIVRGLLDGKGVLTVMSLDPGLQNTLINALSHSGGETYLAVDPRVAENFFQKLGKLLEESHMQGLSPALITDGRIRLYLKRLLARVAPRLSLLSFNEIPDDVEVKSCGLIKVNP